MNDLDLAIQKRVDAEVAKRMAPFVKRFMKVKAEYQALLETMFTLTEGDPQQANGAPQAKKPRAAINVSEEERDLLISICFKYPEHIYTIAKLAETCSYSSRLTGAILRDLVKQGKVVEGPKGKFRAVVVEPGRLGDGTLCEEASNDDD